MNGIALVLDHVTKRYGDRTVVDDLTFTVAPGRVTGFLGPNGSGKSTTMKILLGLAAADGGSARIGDRRYVELDDPSATVGAALETNAFHPGRSGRDHLRILACAAGVSDRRVDDSLVAAGLVEAADRRAGTYSLGMRQRLGLAAALLCDPPVLVLDEPGNGLDPQGVRELRDLLRQRAASGGTVFVSSHLLGEVEHLVDDVVVIDEGRLVTSGPLAELRHETALVRSPDAIRLAEALREAGASVEPGGPEVVTVSLLVRGSSLEEIGHTAFRLGAEISELSTQSGSLEDLFMRWTNQHGTDRVPPAEQRDISKEVVG
jgi:ABC-2 type transport system ATP-binding protein